MRISIDDIHEHPWVYRVVVLLDGEPASGVTEADETGWLRRYMSKDGRLCLVPGMGEVVQETIQGNVQITLSSAANETERKLYHQWRDSDQ